MFRTIPLYKHDPDSDSRVFEWLTANDVDPKDVAASSIALVWGDEFISLIGFHRDAGGTRVVDGEGAGAQVVKEPIVVPLKSAPENHGL
jgi:hypothetical protein